MEETEHPKTWFIRHDNVVTGPYPTGLISNYILLGRIRSNDELSHDGASWDRLTRHPELIPDVMRTDLSDPANQERLKAARRWADERGTGDQREKARQHYADEERRAGNRRRSEDTETMAARENREVLNVKTGRRKQNLLLGYILAISVLVLFIGILINNPFVSDDTAVDCGAAPAPGVNWNNCRIAGLQAASKNLSGANLSNASLTSANLRNSNLSNADLSYADASLANFTQANMTGARLVGTMLRGAKLKKATLRGADLSYANLSNADIRGIDLTNARLDNAVWYTGQTCLAGSIGRCLIPKK
ncbi:MAG: hypothetical protein BMS9Abin26_1226 [Gammaproteobacteria bacterium]|nr:MAG: hypothetical protein BMS9Abin26_1226 [Gammaproteobacteria bacterium]